MWQFRKRKEVYLKNTGEIGELSLNGSLRRGDIHYIIVQVSDDVLEEIPNYLKLVAGTLEERDGVVTVMMSSIIMATFGFPFPQEFNESRAICAETAHQIVRLLGNKARIVWGASAGLYGNLGTDHVFRYGPVFCNLQNAIDALLKLNFGELARVG